MPTPEQKKLWQEEKAQLLRDKKNQPREIRKRAIPLSFGKQPSSRTTPPQGPTDDSFLRQQLGI